MHIKAHKNNIPTYSYSQIETPFMFESIDQRDEVDHLMLNAQLRTELEPFLDESLYSVDMRHMTTPCENEFLASMLAWEKAPVLPIYQWFQPELQLPSPDSLNSEEVSLALEKAIATLYAKKIVLEFTDHLNDRELYNLIYRDILPSPEKKVDMPKNYLHWHCIDDKEDFDTWLRFYATHDERETWSETTDGTLPPAETPPYSRRMPRKP